MVEKYHFGLIVVNGKEYNRDVEIRWDDEILPWIRKESHIIDIGDAKRAIEQKPEIIVIGTGESGVVEIFEDAQKEILSKGIELIVKETGEAVNIFNDLKIQGKKVIGLFHLTC